MALWMKKDDGTLVEVSGGSGGSGDGGGPHDHAEYALVEHDHDDYLPLTGGTVTGDLQVSGQMSVFNGTSSAPTYSFWNDRTVGLYLVGFGKAGFAGNLQVDGNIQARAGGSASVVAYGFAGDTEGLGMYSQVANQWLRFAAGGVQRMQINNEQVIVNNDLRVDGQIKGPQGTQAAPTYSSVNDPSSGFYAGNFGGNKSAAISVDGVYRVHVAAATTRITNDLQVDGTINGTLAFAIAEDIDTRDVLERAETATMPVVDDDGVVTADAEVESVTVNEVVTALLAKVKELSARIEELEGN